MRLLGMVLALGAIAWVLLSASGGREESGVVPQAYQDSVNQAEALEQTLQDAAQEKLKDLGQ